MPRRRRGRAIAIIPAEAGMMPSTPMRLSLLTVIPAKAGIHGAPAERRRPDTGIEASGCDHAGLAGT